MCVYIGKVWIVSFTIYSISMTLNNLFSVEIYCIHYVIIPVVSHCFIQISSHGIVQSLRIICLILELGWEKRIGQIWYRWPKINVPVWQFVHRSHGLTNTLANFLVHIQFAVGMLQLACCSWHRDEIQSSYRLLPSLMALHVSRISCCACGVIWWSFTVSFLMRTQL